MIENWYSVKTSKLFFRNQIQTYWTNKTFSTDLRQLSVKQFSLNVTGFSLHLTQMYKNSEAINYTLNFWSFISCFYQCILGIGFSIQSFLSILLINFTSCFLIESVFYVPWKILWLISNIEVDILKKVSWFSLNF